MARRRRRERLAGTLLTLVGIAVLVIAIVALRHPHTSGTRAGSVTASPTHHTSAPVSHSPSHVASSAASHSSSTTATAGKLPLIVLNNTTVNGLAKQAAQTFTAGGWTVTNYGNYNNDILSTCAYYDPTYPGAQAAAEALRAQFPAIKRDVPKFFGLPAGPIVVVLTPDYISH